MKQLKLKRAGIAAMAALGALAFLTSAHAHGGEAHGHGWGFQGPGSGYEGRSADPSSAFFRKAYFLKTESGDLSLTDDQMKTIEGLELDAEKSHVRYEADQGVADLDIRAGLHAQPIDVAAVQKLIDGKYEAKKTYEKGMVDSLAKLKAVLNDKQIAALKSMKQGREKSGEPDAPEKDAAGGR